VRKRIGILKAMPEVPRREWQPLPLALRTIFETEATPVAVAYRGYGYTLREIAEHLGCHYSTVSRRLHRQETANLDRRA